MRQEVIRALVDAGRGRDPEKAVEKALNEVVYAECHRFGGAIRPDCECANCRAFRTEKAEGELRRREAEFAAAKQAAVVASKAAEDADSRAKSLSEAFLEGQKQFKNAQQEVRTLKGTLEEVAKLLKLAETERDAQRRVYEDLRNEFANLKDGYNALARFSKRAKDAAKVILEG